MSVQFAPFTRLPVEIIRHVLNFVCVEDLQTCLKLKFFQIVDPNVFENRCQKYRHLHIGNQPEAPAGHGATYRTPLDVLDDLQSDGGLLRHVESMTVHGDLPQNSITWFIRDINSETSASMFSGTNESSHVQAVRKWGSEHVFDPSEFNLSTDRAWTSDGPDGGPRIGVQSQLETLNDLVLLLANLPNLQRLHIPLQAARFIQLTSTLNHVHRFTDPLGQWSQPLRVLGHLEKLTFQLPAGHVETGGFSYSNLDLGELACLASSLECSGNTGRVIIKGARSSNVPGLVSGSPIELYACIRRIETHGCGIDARALRTLAALTSQIPSIVWQQY